ncbi:matrixin family metalloprotease [Streptococcus porcinus]|uniref:Matrixin family metalloprotease n=1 Tax=Streptococcus porcinus TaxID=1340 RepID=A0A7W0ASY7_STRPO|nr:M57 family metalloprotease [Streptococcus porcinus]MBA2796774.1 matrixin family metalloprotease [Streptococcus porcinus]
MKKFLKALLWLPLKILQVIWRIIWGFLQTIIILAILIFGLLYYANHSDSALANQISTVSDKIVRLYNVWNNTQTKVEKQVKQTLNADHLQHTHGVKWPDNQAKVYIKTTNPIFHNAYQAALNNWNSTGAFRFIVVDDSRKADIIADESNDKTANAAGLANVESQPLTQTITSVKVYLNAYYLLDDRYGYSSERIVHTAEHELGHAIGLEHTDNQVSVMQTAGSFYGIQAADVARVKNLYEKKN